MKSDKQPKIIIPYSDGNVIFKIIDDLCITDSLDIHIADHPNIRFRYMWNLNRVRNHLEKLEKRLNNFKKKVCNYWAHYILLTEDQKSTADKIETTVLRAWGDDIVSDEEEIEEYIDLAMSGKFSGASDRLNVSRRDKIKKEMYPLIYKDDEVVWFRGLETEHENILKWRKIREELEVSIECLKDKGFSLSALKDLKMEGLLDLYTARKRMERDVKEKFSKRNN
jgi:hypothetical protein